MKPKVSIVIPTFGLLNYLQACLNSVIKHTTGSYEIIVVDNGSRDGTIEFLKTVPQVNLIANGQNLGFSRACNKGLAAAKGEYVVFLNNDTLVIPGWLEALVNCLERDTTLGAAGSKLLYPFTNVVQHAGIVFIERNGLIEPFHIYYKVRDGYSGVNKARQFQAVTGACLMVKKKVTEQIGGFDAAFLNGYEDVDLCLRIREAGWGILYCPQSVVYHFEAVSPGRAAHLALNHQNFYGKWQGKLKTDDLRYYADDSVKVVSDNGLRGFAKPLVSIIMVTFNELDFTRKRIDSVFQNTTVPFELIVSDNGSTDGTQDYLVRREGIKYVLNRENRDIKTVFSESTKYALGKHSVRLNREIAVTPGWLENLLKIDGSETIV